MLFVSEKYRQLIQVSAGEPSRNVAAKKGEPTADTKVDLKQFLKQDMTAVEAFDQAFKVFHAKNITSINSLSTKPASSSGKTTVKPASRVEENQALYSQTKSVVKHAENTKTVKKEVAGKTEKPKVRTVVEDRKPLEKPEHASGGKRFLRNTIEKLEKIHKTRETTSPSYDDDGNSSYHPDKDSHGDNTHVKKPRVTRTATNTVATATQEKTKVKAKKKESTSSWESHESVPIQTKAVVQSKEQLVVAKVPKAVQKSIEDKVVPGKVKQVPKMHQMEVKIPPPTRKSKKTKTPFQPYPPLRLFYWNPNSIGVNEDATENNKRAIIENEDSHMIFLVEPYHKYEIPGFVTACGLPLDKKTKIYSQMLWREELPIELVSVDVDLIVAKMNVPHLTNPIYFFCVYISHTEERRLKCLALIEETLAAANALHTGKDKPLVIMVGDFNHDLFNLDGRRNPTNKALNALLKQFTVAHDMKHNEITRERVVQNGKRHERSRIDWMLFSKYGLKIQSRVIKESMQYSDHFAFVFDVTM